MRAGLPEARRRLTLISGGLDRLTKTAKDLQRSDGLDRVAGGLYQAYAPNLTEGARNAGALLENLKVQISGNVLQTMREMSKTGGAVGQVTEREWPRLENMIAALDPSQGKEQFLQQLAVVISYADQVKGALETAYRQDLQMSCNGGRLSFKSRFDAKQTLSDVAGGFTLMIRYMEIDGRSSHNDGRMCLT